MNILNLNLIFLCLSILAGCDQSAKLTDASVVEINSDEVDQFVKAIKRNLVFVEGGEFLMGDFGSQYGPGRLPYDGDEDSKSLHKVRLSSYSIDKFKVTNKNFQFYLDYKGLKLRSVDDGNQENWIDINAEPTTPAHMDWYEAEQYCAWLAQVSNIPFALPTEAQWEYAARSRGRFLIVATNDGTYKTDRRPVTEHDGPRGINISSSWDREAFAKEMGWKTEYFTPLPVDRFPPNPLGLYAMSDNGLEWVQDWYDPNYYQYSPVEDPQGPREPRFKDYFGRETKVVRGQDFANPI